MSDETVYEEDEQPEPMIPEEPIQPNPRLEEPPVEEETVIARAVREHRERLEEADRIRNA